MNLLARIVVDLGICHGRPTIRGLRYPVEMVPELRSFGMTADEILADYEDLEHADIMAALAERPLAIGAFREILPCAFSEPARGRRLPPHIR